MREKRAWSEGFSNVSKETFGVYPDVTTLPGPTPAPVVDDGVEELIGVIGIPDEMGETRLEGEGEGEI